jgi:hypothetical protein
MADAKISALTSLAATDVVDGDLIPIVDVSANSTKQITRGDLYGGAWTSYTPTVGGAGWALGNGTISGRYKKIGRVVSFYIAVTWGSTSTFGGSALTLTLPTAALSTGVEFPTRFVDSGTAGYQGVGYTTASSTTLGFFVYTTGSTYAGEAGITTSVPHGWANADSINIGGTYESTT